MDLQTLRAQYPHITKAAILILYDNGMVNRFTTEEAELTAVASRLATAYTDEELAVCERELAALSADQLEVVCCGDGGGEQWWSAETDGVLNCVFEG